MSWIEIETAANTWVDNHSALSGLLFTILGVVVGWVFNIPQNVTKLVTKTKEYFKFTDKSKTTQTMEMEESPDAVQQNAATGAVNQAGQGNGLNTMTESPGAVQQTASTINNNFLGGVPRVASSQELLQSPPQTISDNSVTLSSGQIHIMTKLSQTTQLVGSLNGFQDRYQNAIRHLNGGNTHVCAAEYHGSFLNIVPIFLKRDTYGTSAPEETNLQNFSQCFENLKKFMSDSSIDDAELRRLINAFESALITLLGYV